MAQDRLLVDAIWSSIEILKTRATSLAQVRQAQLKSSVRASSPEGGLLHWAELEADAGSLKGVRQSARNPQWTPAIGWDVFEPHYLGSVLNRLSLRELKDNGVAMLRIRQDPHRPQEWLALAFQGDSLSSVLLVLVDPADAFPIFDRWASRSEGGNLRGYLIGTDGLVLAHSQRTYVATDFGSTQVFQEGVREMLQGRFVSGAGTYKSIEGAPVSAAFARPGTLPMGAVVERMAPSGTSGITLAGLDWVLRAPSEAIVVLIALLAACGWSVFWIRRWIRQASATSMAVAAAEPEIVQLPASGESSRQEVQTEQFLLARFESEVLQEPDPRIVAHRLVDAASELMGAPALFFSYQPKLRAAILQAHSGEDGTMRIPPAGSMSFSLSEAVLERISRYEREGRTAPLSDEPTLNLILAKRLGSSKCDAWPVMGREGKLLGVLVVLNSGGPADSTVRSTKLESLGKIMRNLDA